MAFAFCRFLGIGETEQDEGDGSTTPRSHQDQLVTVYIGERNIRLGWRTKFSRALQKLQANQVAAGLARWKFENVDGQ